jgi:hypothetical protein
MAAGAHSGPPPPPPQQQQQQQDRWNNLMSSENNACHAVGRTTVPCVHKSDMVETPSLDRPDNSNLRTIVVSRIPGKVARSLLKQLMHHCAAWMQRLRTSSAPAIPQTCPLTTLALPADALT